MRFVLRLLLLLLAAQAALPRDLVCCTPENGRPALELALNGHCIGIVEHVTEHGHSDGTQIQTPAGAGLQAVHGDCEDSALLTADARPVRVQPVTPPAVHDIVVLPPQHRFSPAESALKAQRDCLSLPGRGGPPLRLTGCVLLRI